MTRPAPVSGCAGHPAAVRLALRRPPRQRSPAHPPTLVPSARPARPPWRSPSPRRPSPAPHRPREFAEAYVAEDVGPADRPQPGAASSASAAVTPGAGRRAAPAGRRGQRQGGGRDRHRHRRQRRLAAARHAPRRRADHDRRRGRAPADRPADLRRRPGFAAGRTRIITGRALDVLPRLADGATTWSSSTRDADRVRRRASDAALRLLRPGGVLVVNGALAGGRIGDPAGPGRRTRVTRPRDACKARPRGGRSWIPALLPGRRRPARPRSSADAASTGVRRSVASQRSSVRTPQPVAPLTSSPSVAVGPGRRRHVDVRPAVAQVAGELAQVQRGHAPSPRPAPGRCSGRRCRCRRYST